MKVKTALCASAISLLLLLLSGCSIGEELTEWAAGKANDALEVVGGGVQEVIDDLHDAEYQGGPFENNLESARAYLLTQLQEKYGIEFTIVGDEDLENYGPFAGVTYTCDVAPIDAPEQVTTALVSQTMYQDVRDSYAVYFFKDEAEAPVLELCETIAIFKKANNKQKRQTNAGNPAAKQNRVPYEPRQGAGPDFGLSIHEGGPSSWTTSSQWDSDRDCRAEGIVPSFPFPPGPPGRPLHGESAYCPSQQCLRA